MKHLIKYIRIRTGLTLPQVANGLIIGGFIGMLFYILLASIPPPEPRNRPGVADKKVKAAMVKHGVQVAYSDRQGVYFEREGKRCKL